MSWQFCPMFLHCHITLPSINSYFRTTQLSYKVNYSFSLLHIGVLRDFLHFKIFTKFSAPFMSCVLTNNIMPHSASLLNVIATFSMTEHFHSSLILLYPWFLFVFFLLLMLSYFSKTNQPYKNNKKEIKIKKKKLLTTYLPLVLQSLLFLVYS